MSIKIKTLNKGILEGCGFWGPDIEEVHIGEYTLSVEEFAAFASYVLRGGLVGWSTKGPPLCVHDALAQLGISAEEKLEKMGPKPHDHPSVGELCPVCKNPFKEGDFTTLVPLCPGNSEEAKKKVEGRAYKQVAVEVHWDCWKGTRGDE